MIIRSREDLVLFIRHMVRDLETNKESWQNATLQGFQCSIDFTPFKEGVCPVKLPLKTLGEGEHTFEVRAVDTDERIEEQSAVHIWKQ